MASLAELYFAAHAAHYFTEMLYVIAFLLQQVKH
jgi:hypothetical protein